MIQTREMESLMRLQSGQTAVLGGLMQDSVTNIEDGIPGVNQIPGVGHCSRSARTSTRRPSW